jgi:hypothetical protein
LAPIIIGFAYTPKPYSTTYIPFFAFQEKNAKLFQNDRMHIQLTKKEISQDYYFCFSAHETTSGVDAVSI